MSDDYENRETENGETEDYPETDTPEMNETAEAEQAEETAEAEPVFTQEEEPSQDMPVFTPPEENPQGYEDIDSGADSGEEIPCVEAQKVEKEHRENPYGQVYGQNNAYGSYGNPADSPYNRTENYSYGRNPGADGRPPYEPAHGYAPTPVVTKKSNKGLKVFLSILALVVVFALGAAVATLVKGGKLNPNANSDGHTVTRGEESTAGDDTELVINGNKNKGIVSKSGTALTPSEIAEKVRASNVGIVVSIKSNMNSSTGEGSGVVMGLDSTGKYTYIITCAHVIDTSGAAITVHSESGEIYEAEIVGYDVRTDLGVIKVETTDLQPAEFGNSDDLVIGDPVYAIGNPGGVEFFGSFTGGFVSAINRPIDSEIGYTMKCIQHDASINPGNSGGMLVNQYGQVIGINSQKIANTSYEGMGFAIPITSAKEIIDDLIKYSYVPNRPKLGITYYPVSASSTYNLIARVNNLPSGTLIIESIDSESSLNGTKVSTNDMIVAVNNKPLTSADVLLEVIDNGSVGDKIELTIARVNSDYQVDTFNVTATLVEDKGTPETTTTQAFNPYEWYFNFGN